MIEIIDAHAHMTRSMSFRTILDRMDESRVSMAAVMVREAREERLLGLARRFPGRILPLAGGGFFQAAMQRGSRRSRARGKRRYVGFDKGAWPREARRAFPILERMLRSGAFHGIGEIRLKHRGFGPGVPEMKCDYDFEPDSAPVLRLLDLAAEARVPVTIHLEVDTDRRSRLRGLDRALSLRPAARVIWAHGGPCGPATLERMLGRHGNLYAEIQPLIRNTYAHRVPFLKTFPRLADGAGRLLRVWRDLFERHPDRFVVGSDARTAEEYKHYRTRMEDMRLILAQLSPGTRRRIAYGNASRLFSVRCGSSAKTRNQSSRLNRASR